MEKLINLERIMQFYENIKSKFVKKNEIDNLELITVDDIDTICGTTIQDASVSEVSF